MVVNAIEELKAPKRYPAACLINPVLGQAIRLDEELFFKLNEEAVGEAPFKDVRKIRSFIEAPSKLRTEAIAKFERRELEAWEDFFDTFEKNPLTPEQRLSVISDEDATLVLAGAGSGKTSVITAKAGYLIKAGIRQPEEILLLAFARGAAAEMSERIAERCGDRFARRCSACPQNRPNTSAARCLEPRQKSWLSLLKSRPHKSQRFHETVAVLICAPLIHPNE